MAMRFNGVGPDVTRLMILWVAIILGVGIAVGYYLGEKAGAVRGRDDWIELARRSGQLHQPENLTSGSTFHGFPCVDDCSGHQAGYAWAEAHAILRADRCGGDSQSFKEGCIAYTRER